MKEELYKSFPAILSSDELTDAKGRRERKWEVYKGALACTFSLPKHKVITLSALEIAVLVNRYFKKEYQIQLPLKWPNDLYDKNLKKCGGILINSSKENLIVGLGMNLEKGSEYGNVFEGKSPITCKELAIKLYQFIITNRLASQEIINDWNQNCFHIGMQVSMEEDNKKSIGEFKGIGSNGQAILIKNSKEEEFYSATLRPLP